MRNKASVWMRRSRMKQVGGSCSRLTLIRAKNGVILGQKALFTWVIRASFVTMPPPYRTHPNTFMIAKRLSYGQRKRVIKIKLSQGQLERKHNL